MNEALGCGQHRLGLEESLETEHAVLAPEARLAEAAERSLRLVQQPVDQHASGHEPSGDGPRPHRIGGQHVGLQPVIGVVGDRLVLAALGEDRQHRAENLLAGDGHAIVDANEHGRTDEVAVLQAGRLAFAAGTRMRLPAMQAWPLF